MTSSAERPARPALLSSTLIVLAASAVIALLYAPLLFWMGRASIQVTQLSTGGILVLVTLILCLRETLHTGRLQPEINIHGAILLAWAMIGLGAAGYLPRWALPLVLLSFCLAVAAVVSFLFGRLGVREFLPAIGAFFVLGLLVGLFPALDWPLRALAGRQAGNLLAMLHQSVQLIVVNGRPPEVLLEVAGRVYVVATECNGFGLLTSAVLVATILAFQERLPWLSRVGLIALAVPIAIVCNFLRIVGISLIAPRLPLSYGFIHEAVGIVFYLAGLGLVWWAAEWSARKPSPEDKPC
jgi:exosortase/archaeosortase family protein